VKRSDNIEPVDSRKYDFLKSIKEQHCEVWLFVEAGVRSTSPWLKAAADVILLLVPGINGYHSS
jgi:hypothetical protein